MKLLRTALLAMLATLGLAGFAAADDEIYREYFPRQPIDPAKGYLGDETWSGSVRYWKDAATLARNLSLAKDHANEWKLNLKFMDIDSDAMNSGHFVVDQGEALVKTLSGSEPDFLTCLGEGKTDLRGLGAAYPKFDSKLGRIMTVDSRVEHCARTTLRRELAQGTPDNVRITTYIKSLSTGTPLNVDIQSKPIMQAYARGEKLFYTKAGQYNFACASCHSPQGMVGKRFRGEAITSMFSDAAHYPSYRIGKGMVESMHERLRTCNAQSRTVSLPFGDPAYVDIEVFLSVLANGYPIAVPVERY